MRFAQPSRGRFVFQLALDSQRGYFERMHCPFCHHPDSRVVDTRSSEDGTTIRRRRECPECKRRFSTSETASLTIVKRSGATEPFSRQKIISGVGKACQGRPVTADQLAILAQKVEERIRATGQSQVDAYDVGMAILDPLRELDQIAYLRFASVYSNFESLEDFEAEIERLRARSSYSESALDSGSLANSAAL